MSQQVSLQEGEHAEVDHAKAVELEEQAVEILLNASRAMAQLELLVSRGLAETAHAALDVRFNAFMAIPMDLDREAWRKNKPHYLEASRDGYSNERELRSRMRVELGLPQKE